jgi:hypothetical protein
LSDPAHPALTRLGWRAERRPVPGFAHVLGAAAGAFVVVAIVAFVVEVAGDDATAPGVGFSAALAIVALVAGFRAPGPLRSAAVTTLVLTIPILWFFVLAGDGSGGRDEIRGIYLLSLGCYLALYFASWTRGRAVFLAGALLFFATWITFEVADTAGSIIPFQGEVSGTTSNTDIPGFEPDTTALGDADDTTSSTAAAALVIGCGFLAAGFVLDRRKLTGVATPFLAVGAFEAIAGAAVLGGNESALLGGLLAMSVGALVGIIGAQGDRRRGTTWIGVLAVFFGLVAVLADLAPDSAAGVGAIALAFAAGLGVLAWRLAPLLGEPDDGDGQPPASPVPPGADFGRMPDEAAA